MNPKTPLTVNQLVEVLDRMPQGSEVMIDWSTPSQSFVVPVTGVQLKVIDGKEVTLLKLNVAGIKKA
jgi:hypothetical protein